MAKASGPDKISVLKQCSRQLATIFTFIYNMSFKLISVPEIRKRSCINPVPKKPTISCMNDVRPVALTFVPMKSCERFVLRSSQSCVGKFMDPLQFAYRTKRSTEDAILLVLDRLYRHLDKSRL